MALLGKVEQEVEQLWAYMKENKVSDVEKLRAEIDKINEWIKDFEEHYFGRTNAFGRIDDKQTFKKVWGKQK